MRPMSAYDPYRSLPISIAVARPMPLEAPVIRTVLDITIPPRPYYSSSAVRAFVCAAKLYSSNRGINGSQAVSARASFWVPTVAYFSFIKSKRASPGIVMPIAPLILRKENPHVPNLAFGSNDHLDLRRDCRCRKGSLGSVGDGISLAEISTRGTLHAWSWPEMVRKTRTDFHAEFRALVIAASRRPGAFLTCEVAVSFRCL
jgi:hypothetical protein